MEVVCCCEEIIEDQFSLFCMLILNIELFLIVGSSG